MITVERTFCLRGGRESNAPLLIIHPDFSVPVGGWKELTETVAVQRPDGRKFEAAAQISLSHFNISDPDASMDRRWRVTVLFPGKTSEDIPIGSKILVSQELRNALLSKTADSPSLNSELSP